MSNEIQLGFDLSGTCHQIIDVYAPEVWTEEKIVDGLQKGELFTSTWHNGRDTQAFIVKMDTMEHIGEIISQEIDGEYFDFR
jgi:hypothetical protein